MANNIFKRYELKYMLSLEQYKNLQIAMEQHMTLDMYGKHTISNIYFDTDDYILIRRSIEKPCYKEKLRVRSYGKTGEESKIFVELKKKYKGVVYKRRVDLSHHEAYEYLTDQHSLAHPNQITREIDYFKNHYEGLKAKVFLSYDREAYFGNVNKDFRMTFDQNIRMRDYDINLTKGVYGDKILQDGLVLLEVKTAMGLPKWLLDCFSENEIYKTSFSKYGTAYKNHLLPKLLGGKHNVA